MRRARVGQWVVVRGHEREGAARVEQVEREVAVHLSRPLSGKVFWHVEDLEVAGSGYVKPS